MAQAERITTAIRQLMSRGRPPPSTNPVRLAHTERLDNLFRDLSGDAVGATRNAADEMREHENWRAS